MSKQIIGIIPARFASTRFPGKPLIKISGKSLLQRTYENALLSKSLNEIVIATDDERIFQHVHSFGGKVVMTSVDCPTGTDRLAEVLHQHPEWMEAAAIVNIQGDEPCLNPKAIDQVIHILLSDPEGHMSTAVTPLRSSAEALSSSVVKCVMDRHQNALYFSRALIPSHKTHGFQTHTTYYQHMGLYAYRPRFLAHYQTLAATPLQLAEDLEQLKVLEHGYRIKVAIVEGFSLGVDTPEDIIKIEEWICKQNTSLLQAESAPL